MTLAKRLCGIWLIGVFFFCVGCGPDRPPMGQVSGTVTWKGKPLESGFINFVTPGQRDASGKIVNGKIVEVFTYDEADGVPVGKAKVAVMAVKENPKTHQKSRAETQDAPQASAVTLTAEYITPIRYANPDTSGLTATIREGTNELKFELTQ